jgi:alkylhydroperoxidase family enzyme
MSDPQTATRSLSSRRLPLADDPTMNSLLMGPAAKLPPINLFRALANATSLAPDYMRYFARLFEPLELDSRIERLLVLLTGKLSGCEYVWRQNVVVAKSLGISDEEIAALGEGDLQAPCFSPAQTAVFRFAEEALEVVEVTDATYAEADKYFSPRALTEVLFVVGSYMFLSRLVRTGGVPLDEKPAEVPPGALK